MRPGRLIVLALLAAAAGCGEDLKDHQAEVASNPYALTCDDLARQPDTSSNQRLVIHVEFALADAPVLRRRVAEMTSNRVGRSIYWALTELCKGSPGSYEPARAAVEAVRQGKYLVQPRPEKWSHPERYSDPVVKELNDGR